MVRKKNPNLNKWMSHPHPVRYRPSPRRGPRGEATLENPPSEERAAVCLYHGKNLSPLLPSIWRLSVSDPLIRPPFLLFAAYSPKPLFPYDQIISVRSKTHAADLLTVVPVCQTMVFFFRGTGRTARGQLNGIYELLRSFYWRERHWL